MNGHILCLVSFALNVTAVFKLACHRQNAQKAAKRRLLSNRNHNALTSRCFTVSQLRGLVRITVDVRHFAENSVVLSVYNVLLLTNSNSCVILTL